MYSQWELFACSPRFFHCMKLTTIEEGSNILFYPIAPHGAVNMQEKVKKEQAIFNLGLAKLDLYKIQLAVSL